MLHANAQDHLAHLTVPVDANASIATIQGNTTITSQIYLHVCVHEYEGRNEHGSTLRAGNE